MSDEFFCSEATCETPATYYFSCTCGKTDGSTFEYGNALGHDYQSSVTREVSCFTEGVRHYNCTRCGASYDEAIDPLCNHAFDKRIDNEKYLRVDYIESTGTQYIDTGFATTNGMITEFECTWLGKRGGYMVGSHNPSYPYGRNGGYLDIAKGFWELGYGEIFPNTTKNLDVVGKKVNVKFSTVSGQAYLLVDGQKMLEINETQQTSSLNVLLFHNQYSLNEGADTTVGRLYSASVWDCNGVLVREFIPVLRISDEKPGMYDTVTATFFPSVTNDFEYGEILYHTFGEEETVLSPTYCTQGITKLTCRVCGFSVNKTIDKTSYRIGFDCGEHAKVYVYDSQNYSSAPLLSTEAYSRNNSSFEYSKNDAQVNFKVLVDDGYVLNGIEIDGAYKNLKNQNDGIYRITKITSDLTVKLNIGISLSASVDSGFYTDSFQLALSSSQGTIYYTLDGTTPTKDSLVYTAPITISDASLKPNTNSMLTTTSGGFLEDKINTLGQNTNAYPYFVPGYKAPDTLIDKGTVIKAIAIDGDTVSEEICRTYFVGFDNKTGYDNTGIISLIVEPEDFFGYENGIYVRGKTYDTVDSNSQWYSPYWWWWGNYSNSGDAWERKVNLSFFNQNKELVLQQNAGTRIHGNGSRGYAVKSLNFYARSEYDGNDIFDYDFFGNGYQAQRLTLSSGGDDYQVKIYDYLMSAVSEDAAYCMVKMQRYCLFINGEYWGNYYLSEKPDEEYFEFYYGIDKDNIIMIKDGSVEEGNNSDLNLYQEMISFISGNDMTKEANYQQALNMIDIDSYIDYYASMAYIGRTGDWPGGNTAWWRSREAGNSPYEDCKWRLNMFDINSGAYGEYDKDWINYICTNNAVFRHLYRNEAFKAQFNAKLVELAKTRFNSQRINSLLDTFVVQTRNQMIKEYERFFGSANTKITDTFDITVQSVRAYMNNRNRYVLDTYATSEHSHSYQGTVTKEATFTEKGIKTYTCECGDTYTEDIPVLKYEDYAYAADFTGDEHIKVYIYEGQKYDKEPTLSAVAYSTDKKGNLLKDGEGQINFLVVCDEGYSYSISVAGNYKNIKGSEETEVDNVYRITKIKSDLQITITSAITGE